MQVTPNGHEPIISPRLAIDADGKTNLLGLDREELKTVIEEIGVPEKQVRMRANQVWSWVYHHGVTSFDDMSNVSKDVRTKLAEHFVIKRPEIVEAQYSNDGTRKYLIREPGGFPACCAR